MPFYQVTLNSWYSTIILNVERCVVMVRPANSNSRPRSSFRSKTYRTSRASNSFKHCFTGLIFFCESEMVPLIELYE